MKLFLSIILLPCAYGVSCISCVEGFDTFAAAFGVYFGEELDQPEIKDKACEAVTPIPCPEKEQVCTSTSFSAAFGLQSFPISLRGCAPMSQVKLNGGVIDRCVTDIRPNKFAAGITFSRLRACACAEDGCNADAQEEMEGELDPRELALIKKKKIKKVSAVNGPALTTTPSFKFGVGILALGLHIF